MLADVAVRDLSHEPQTYLAGGCKSYMIGTYFSSD